MTMQRIIFIGLTLLSCVMTTNGFVVQQSRLSVTTTHSDSFAFQQTQMNNFLQREASKLEAKKQKPEAVEEKKGLDYGDIAMQFVNPLNPYSWFIYFFVGIYVNAAINP
jgi:hypothetical protein